MSTAKASEPSVDAMSKDSQMAFDVAKEYKLHVDSVKKDRDLEEFLEAWL